MPPAPAGFDHNLLAQFLAQALRNNAPGNIARATGGERHHQRERAAGKTLCGGGLSACQKCVTEHGYAQPIARSQFKHYIPPVAPHVVDVRSSPGRPSTPGSGFVDLLLMRELTTGERGATDVLSMGILGT